jgi:outer membrane receptor protein involved in Fe transport
LSQIFQSEHQTLVFGGRYQGGEFHTKDVLTNVQPVDPLYFQDPPASNRVSADIERLSAYGYYTLKPVEGLALTAGLVYDYLVYPANFRSPPISDGETRSDQFGPKAAFVWSPAPEITLRGAYSRSLGGVSFDESFRLEPTQLAGFSQAFRTIIPESVVGSVSAPSHEVIGAALDFKLATGTYVGLVAEQLSSAVSRDDGAFRSNEFLQPQGVTTFREHLDYEETAFAVTLNQLVASEWSLGAQYKFTRSELHTTFPDFPDTDFDQKERADLQQATVFALFNHHSGFFARADVQWYLQDNSAFKTSDFYQFNLFAGWRFPRQRGEVSVGVLNLNDTDYHLNPLNSYSELPRERVFVMRFNFNL